MRLSVDFFFHFSKLRQIAVVPESPNYLLEALQTELETAQSLLPNGSWPQSVLHQALTSIEESSRALFPASDIQNQQIALPFMSNSAENQTHSEYAYAFVIGGCDPDNPSYRGFVYNILVSTQILRDLGSVNDVVAFFQLSYSYQGAATLPDDDVKALRALDVRIYYIRPSPYESFYETVMHKFSILALTQYKRVILMDGDVMPLANMDYLFELSSDDAFGPGNSTLKENVIVAGPWEPANAGFFMLAPVEGEYEHIQEIIKTREEKAMDMEGHKFDEVEGWGHVIEPPDEWVSRKQRGGNWTFHFAFSDQGLLYHWTKYVKKSVSIVFYGRVENIAEDENGNPYLERELIDVLSPYSKPLIKAFGSCYKFMCDYHHFTGLLKPWLRKPPDDVSEATQLRDCTHIWWYYLTFLDKKINLGLDFENWSSTGRPSLGLYATWNDIDKHIKKNANSG
jgi:hypothetical protein